ncbi:MAG: COX15/CtaA family protein [Acidobacteria bacterium]|nr:COX15/CtaA family protein [Acidobacteriota bacterium]
MKNHVEVATKPTLWLHRFAIFLAFLIVILLVAGALVTSNEAGDSVPDWPLSFGRWVIHSENFIANVRFEYSHRFIAGIVGFTTFLFALCIWFLDPRKWMKRLAVLAFFGVVAQAAIGGVRVLLPAYKAAIAVPHALIAQSFFALIVALAVFTSRGWFADHEEQADAGRPSLRRLALLTIGALLIQLVLGAGFRHGAWGVLPHVVGAVMVAALIIWTASVVLIRHQDSDLRRPAWSALFLVLVQIALGIFAYFARVAAKGDPQPLEPMISLTASHVVVGALTLAAMVVLTLRSYRLLAPTGDRVNNAAPDLAASRRATV